MWGRCTPTTNNFTAKYSEDRITNWVENTQPIAITGTKEENRLLFLFLNEIHAQTLTSGQEKDKPQKPRGSLQFFLSFIWSFSLKMYTFLNHIFYMPLGCYFQKHYQFIGFFNEKSSVHTHPWPRCFWQSHPVSSVHCCRDKTMLTTAQCPGCRCECASGYVKSHVRQTRTLSTVLMTYYVVKTYPWTWISDDYIIERLLCIRYTYSITATYSVSFGLRLSHV